MNEATYARACQIELGHWKIPFEPEKAISIEYKGQTVCRQKVDLLVGGELAVEIKSVDKIHPVHVAQAVSYLRAMKKRAALVVNFNVAVLKQGIRRVVL